MNIKKLIEKVDDEMTNKDVISANEMIKKGYVNVSKATVLKYLDTGQISGSRIWVGNRRDWRITKRNILDYLNKELLKQLNDK